MRSLISLMVMSCGLLMTLATAWAQSGDLRTSDAPSGFCQYYLTRYSPELDTLLANKNPEEQLQVVYQAAMRLNLVASACHAAPETNPYNEDTARMMAQLQTELGTDTASRCQAVGTDLFNQIKGSAHLANASQDQAQISFRALRSMNDLAIAHCPEALQPAFAQLAGELDRLEEAARLWPECRKSRTALSDALGELSTKLEDPANDPELLRQQIFLPAVDAFEEDCSFDQNWQRDPQGRLAQVETMIAARTPHERNMCQMALSDVEPRLEAIQVRIEAYRPGCDEHFFLERDNLNDKRAIEVAFNASCKLFPAAGQGLRTQFTREMRLVEELKAEDNVIRWRIDQGETDVVSCDP